MSDTPELPFVHILVPTCDAEIGRATGLLAAERSQDVRGNVIVSVARGQEGYTRTVNRGLGQAFGDVCILVDDCVPEEGWLGKLQAAVYERVALPIWFAGPSGPCRTLPQNSGRPGDMRRPRVVPHLAGFCLYVTREALDKLGGLDEAYTHYASDVDWQRKAQRDYGARSLWVPGVYVDHGLHPPHMEWWGKDQQLLKERWST